MHAESAHQSYQLNIAMWKNPGKPILIDASQLRLGLYIWLDLKWDEHPFLTNRFMLKSEKDLVTIQAYDTTGRLYYYPEKSTTRPLDRAVINTRRADAEEEATAAILSAQKAALQHELSQAEKAKKDTVRQQRAAAQRAEKAWEDAARSTKEALQNMARSPKAAGEQLASMSRETAAVIAKGEVVLLHLLGDKKEQGPQFHALNVLTLCMLVGKKLNLPEQDLADLALAAMAHDVGKALVTPQILKTWPRKKFEEDIYRQHVQFSLELALKSGAFSREALQMIADHHETLDGAGWPKGKKELSTGSKILALVNRYDRLCGPEATGKEPLMPAEALAQMFRNETDKFDKTLLSVLIKLLGIYPPGTVVVLSDESLGLVVSPGPHSLQPRVVIYSPELSKEEAPLIELHNDPELKIAETVKPSSLPPEVLAWLNPQARLSYYFSVNDAS